MARSCPPPFTTAPCSTRAQPLLPPRSRLQISCHRSPVENEKERPPTTSPTSRREIVLRSSEFAALAAIFHFSGTKPSYLGVQKSPPSLALCPATNNCVSTSEDAGDPNHFAPPWNYNPEDGRGKTSPVSREEAKAELLAVVKSVRPDGFTPQIVEMKEEYIRVEYESPIMGVCFQLYTIIKLCTTMFIIIIINIIIKFNVSFIIIINMIIKLYITIT